MHLINTICFIFYILHLQFPPNSTLSSPESLHYVGAVVEYHPIQGISEITAISNVDNHINILKKAKEFNSNLDIIVYPETSILTESNNQLFMSAEEKRNLYEALAFILPDSSKEFVPCEIEDTDVPVVLKKLSCAAKEYKTYIVTNYVEKEKCTNCAKDNINLYNSNVVFDRNGTVIARYRKYNLFLEASFNVTQEAQLSTFETDFGVKFGQFTCFDILFKTPALELQKNHQVTDIVFPTHWFAELPFLDGLSVQAAWSYANDVNLLAAGFNNPSTGSTGSGIFAGKFPEIPILFRSMQNKNALLMSNVPKFINGSRKSVDFERISYEFSKTEIPTITDETDPSGFLSDFLSSFQTILVEPEMDQFVNLCKDEFCCYFHHKAEYYKSRMEAKYYRYRFGVFAGVRSFGVVNLGVQVCGLMICSNDSLSSCGKKLDADDTKFATSFKKLQITAIVPKRERASFLHLPISFQTDYTPLHPGDFSFNSVALDDFYALSLTLQETRRDLMAFGIYSRNFSSDGNEATTLETSRVTNFF